MAAKERGETTVNVSITLGQDPYVWIVSGSRVVNRALQKGKINELAVAGGLQRIQFCRRVLARVPPSGLSANPA